MQQIANNILIAIAFFPIDIRTVYFGYIIINFVNLVLITSLYFQIKQRFPGTLLILLSFVLSATGNILVYLRDTIPDWISIAVANTLVISSSVVLLIAFEKFVKKRGIQIQNYILIFIFFLVFSYFSLIKPDLQARHICFSFTYLLLSSQFVYLMFKRTPFAMRKITRPVGFVFCAVFITQFFHIIIVLQNNLSTNHYFQSGFSESIFLLIWEVITLLLVYSITLMYNKRLIIDIQFQEEKFSKAFHSAPFIILITKLSDGEIIEVNNGVYPISGYKPNELIGVKSTDLNLWEFKTDRTEFKEMVNSNDSVKNKEYVFRKKSGELFHGLISSEFININNEQCIISVINDISIQKRAEEEIRKSEASLRTLNSTKDKFFSIIAHDLKSPFNAILGFSDLLVDKVRNKNYNDLEKFAEIINSSSQKAMNLLSNLLEWSRSQTGKMEFNPEYIDLVAVINSVRDLLMVSAQQKSIAILLNLPDNLFVQADNAMIETVLRNLISNAIKFTPQNGTVLISAEIKNEECLVFVKDNGIGIRKEDQEKLFKIEETCSLPGTENEHGTGLGLILCKDFIDKHKGKIWVKSEEGKGTTMLFSIPV